MKIASRTVPVILFLLLLLAACKKNQSESGCISTDIVNPLSGQSITFTDCVGGAVSATWDFGDGTTGVGITSIKTYYSSGTYTVTLISTSTTGQLSTGKKTIIVKSLPNANFTSTACGSAGAQYVKVGDSVTFSTYNSGSNSFFWDFGDGTTSHDSVPIHVFTQLNSQVIVKLRVSNSAGSDSTTAAYTVLTPYQGTFQFLRSAYGNVGLTNSTGLAAGSTFSLAGYPSYSPYHTTTTIATIVSGRAFVIQQQNITFLDGTGNNNNISGSIHGHGYLVGPCSSATLYIVDTLVTQYGTNIYNDSLRFYY